MPGFDPADLPITSRREGFCQRATTAGGMTIAYEQVPAADYGDLGACPTAHWGYVLQGRAHVRYDDGEEWLEAGQAYYLPPGHRIAVLTASEVIELSLAPPPALPPLATVLGFVDAINRKDLARLASLLAEGHELARFAEPPLVGRDAVIAAWRRDMAAFPAYVIHPSRFVEAGDRIGVLGTTTGSHRGLPDAEERQEALLWIARVEAGQLASWALLPDTPAHRAGLGA